MAGRQTARLMRSRGVLPAASEACSSGRSITRPRLYRRSPRAGCEACTRADKMTAESTARPLLTQCHPALMWYCYKFYYLDDLDPRFTLYVLGPEYKQRSPGKRSPELQRTVPRAPKQIRVTRTPAATGKQLTVMRPKIETGLQPLGAAADVCPGGLKEDEAESIRKMLEIEDAEQLEQDENNELSDDSLSDDDLEGIPLAGNWCTDGDY